MLIRLVTLLQLVAASKIGVDNGINDIYSQIRRNRVEKVWYGLLPKNEWTRFYFSSTGENPLSGFVFDIERDDDCELQLTDAFCPGDQFKVVHSDVGDSENGEIFRTSKVATDHDGTLKLGDKKKSIDCPVSLPNPEEAWESPAWSKGSKALPAGSYEIVIKPLVTPFGAGSAFINLKCRSKKMKICPFSAGGFVLIKSKQNFDNAEQACYSHGLQFASIDNYSIKYVKDILKECGVRGGSAWIRSYENEKRGINRDEDRLTMNAKGTVSTEKDSTAKYPVLCTILDSFS